MNNKFPYKIEDCPIVDALIEIRFETDVVKSATFGMIYNIIKDSYPGKVQNLPITQLPEQIRDNDPSLKFKPLYKIINDKFIIQLGPDVITISSKIPYIGWEEFSNHVLFIVNKILDAKIIKKVIRLGHRYVNFFEGDISNQLTLSLSKIDNYKTQNTLIRTDIISQGFTNTIQIYNNAKYRKVNDHLERSGSIIDIDTSKLYNNDSFCENIKKEIYEAHSCEKTLFFATLKPDFLNSLNPKYDEK